MVAERDPPLRGDGLGDAASGDRPDPSQAKARFETCPECAEQIRATEYDCPFCGAALGDLGLDWAESRDEQIDMGRGGGGPDLERWLQDFRQFGLRDQSWVALLGARAALERDRRAWLLRRADQIRDLESAGHNLEFRTRFHVSQAEGSYWWSSTMRFRLCGKKPRGPILTRLGRDLSPKQPCPGFTPRANDSIEAP